jgi:hypothetical protein
VTLDEGLDGACQCFQDVFFRDFFGSSRHGVFVDAACLWAFAFSMVAIFFKLLFFFHSFVSFLAFFSVATYLLLLVGGAGSTT